MFRLLLAYVLLSPILKVPVPGGYLTASETFLLPSLLLLAAVATRFRFQVRPEAVFLAGYLAIVIVSQAMVPRPFVADTILRAARLVSIITPFFLVVAAKPKTHELVLLFRVSLLSLGVSVLLGSIGFILGWGAFLSDKTFFYGEVVGRRAGGIFQDSGQYGFAIGSWFTLVWTYYLFSKPRWGLGVAFLAIVLALTLVSVYASLSRVAMMMVAISLIIAPVVSGRLMLSTVRRYWMAVVAGLAIVPITLAISGADVAVLFQRVLVDTLNKILSAPDSALSGRLTIWSGYLPLLKTSPLVGTGYKSLMLVHAAPPDNSFLGALVETGLLGAFFFIMFNLTALLKIWRMARYFIRSWWVSAIALLWLEVILAALTADVFTYWGVTPVLMVLLGGTLSAIRGER